MDPEDRYGHEGMELVDLLEDLLQYCWSGVLVSEFGRADITTLDDKDLLGEIAVILRSLVEILANSHGKGEILNLRSRFDLKATSHERIHGH